MKVSRSFRPAPAAASSAVNKAASDAGNVSAAACASAAVRFTALDRYGDPILTGLPGLTDPCEFCPDGCVCRDCRYSAAVRALYCREEVCEAAVTGRKPVLPRFLPPPRPLFYPHDEDTDPAVPLSEAIFCPAVPVKGGTCLEQSRP